MRKSVYNILNEEFLSFVLSVTRKNPSSEIRELPPWAVSGSMSFSVCAPLRLRLEACGCVAAA